MAFCGVLAYIPYRNEGFMRFTKMHGLGNDFIIVDTRHGERAPAPLQIMGLSDRRTGIGCDQFILIEKSKKADAFMRIYNPDGSEAQSCGNATRCVASVLMQEARANKIFIETLGGILECRQASGGRVSVDMGAPKFGWKEIPLAKDVDTMNLPLAGGQANAVAVNMGNPHAVLFMKGVDALDIQKLGPPLEKDPLFPEKANIEFVEVKSESELRMRVWERGAGETMACGSGACAAVVAAAKKGFTGRKVRVVLDGGELDFEWRESDDHILMTGPVSYVFDGAIKLI
jgi:diaminopimelate epimerase